jgi:DNA-binding FadR family transcriptional regulator
MTGQQAPGGVDSDRAPVHGRPAERGLDLARLIVEHSLRLGLGTDGRLPTERQLAADLGVTRSSIRYALAIMQARG